MACESLQLSCEAYKDYYTKRLLHCCSDESHDCSNCSKAHTFTVLKAKGGFHVVVSRSSDNSSINSHIVVDSASCSSGINDPVPFFDLPVNIFILTIVH